MREPPRGVGGGDTRRFTSTPYPCWPLRRHSAPRRGRRRHCSRVILADSPLKTELPGVLKGRDLALRAGRRDLIYANWSIVDSVYWLKSGVSPGYAHQGGGREESQLQVVHWEMEFFYYYYFITIYTDRAPLPGLHSHVWDFPSCRSDLHVIYEDFKISKLLKFPREWFPSDQTRDLTW